MPDKQDPDAVPNELVEVMARLLLDGKTPEEIGALTKVDPELVKVLILRGGAEAAAELRSYQMRRQAALNPSQN